MPALFRFDFDFGFGSFYRISLAANSDSNFQFPIYHFHLVVRLRPCPPAFVPLLIQPPMGFYFIYLLRIRKTSKRSAFLCPRRSLCLAQLGKYLANEKRSAAPLISDKPRLARAMNKLVGQPQQNSQLVKETSSFFGSQKLEIRKGKFRKSAVTIVPFQDYLARFCAHLLIATKKIS